MRIGIGLPGTIPGVPGSLLVDWARRAEERGFTSVATLDRITYPSYESLVALAGAAAVTERIELLTNILLGPTRNPVLLAKEAASVDQLSRGRLTLGLGVGTRPDDYAAAERDFRTRGRRFDRDLETMHAVWRGEEVLGSSRPLGPEPVRDRRIPVLMGGTHERAIERAVRWGIGWTAGGSGADQIPGIVERVRAAWEAAGRDGRPRIVALTYYSMLEHRVEESRSSLLDYYEYLGQWAPNIADGAPRGKDAVRDAVRRFEDAGVDELIFDPTVADLREVDLLADTVL
ncbi:MAG TPA: LLM class flavin-dependent oxidoreductase [Actinomycetota bacterium]|nr:LLM class flavin-dependent oxidoreductase [Actinomycetota bacterium]